jgi:hypothetical protein
MIRLQEAVPYLHPVQPCIRAVLVHEDTKKFQAVNATIANDKIWEEWCGLVGFISKRAAAIIYDHVRGDQCKQSLNLLLEDGKRRIRLYVPDAKFALGGAGTTCHNYDATNMRDVDLHKAPSPFLLFRQREHKEPSECGSPTYSYSTVDSEPQAPTPPTEEEETHNDFFK